MNSIWLWIIQTLTLLAIGAIAYFLKDIKKTIDERLAKNEGRIEALEKEVSNLKSDLPFVYVLREDFIRAMANVEKKLDDIYKLLLVNGKGSQ
ncbi:MAG: hypothetical protein QHH10_12010 [Peptococcaceae bacterium]|jgi:CRISPR/Cas system-associated endonuclease Cas3-HD|nr:hypothetical protein [Peptococcaceae bacterium]MDH7526028.1 hypothetical protein [Peptococcaceae bacterium]